jgi:hypothetical protein
VEAQRRTVISHGESDAHGTSSAKRLTIPATEAVALLLMSGFSWPGDAQFSHFPPSFHAGPCSIGDDGFLVRHHAG